MELRTSRVRAMPDWLADCESLNGTRPMQQFEDSNSIMSNSVTASQT